MKSEINSLKPFSCLRASRLFLTLKVTIFKWLSSHKRSGCFWKPVRPAFMSQCGGQQTDSSRQALRPQHIHASMSIQRLISEQFCLMHQYEQVKGLVRVRVTPFFSGACWPSCHKIKLKSVHPWVWAGIRAKWDVLEMSERCGNRRNWNMPAAIDGAGEKQTKNRRVSKPIFPFCCVFFQLFSHVLSSPNPILRLCC